MTEKSFKEKILCLTLLTWMLFWSQSSLIRIKANIPYYKFAINSSLDQLHAIQFIPAKNGQEYYSILKFCDESIPRGENVRLILPQKFPPTFEFLKGKGRYFLYPRNYGDNDEQANYILVYQVNDFIIPKEFNKTVIFNEDSYLLVKQGFQTFAK